MMGMGKVIEIGGHLNKLYLKLKKLSIHGAS
jgi:hypothetical protein